MLPIRNGKHDRINYNINLERVACDSRKNKTLRIRKQVKHLGRSKADRTRSQQKKCDYQGLGGQDKELQEFNQHL